jgi:hypothetical protein
MHPGDDCLDIVGVAPAADSIDHSGQLPINLIKQGVSHRKKRTGDPVLVMVMKRRGYCGWGGQSPSGGEARLESETP